MACGFADNAYLYTRNRYKDFTNQLNFKFIPMRKGILLPMLLFALFGLSPGAARAVDVVDGVYQIGTAADF